MDKKELDIYNYTEEISYTDEDIVTYIKDWVNNKISKTFEFRPHQLETIVTIIQNILTHKYRNYVVEAPTGSGKSLINMIAAGVLAEYFDITSYILVSDLFLWEQYENFLKKHKKTCIATLKGQTGNYVCKLNGEDMKNADCKMAGLSWAAMFNWQTCEKYGYECAATCEYVRARKKAVKAKVCIMTYQLFLFIMNNPQFNCDSHGSPIFVPHQVLFCDECHNIPEIVQLQYAPTIVESDFEKLESLYNGTTDPQISLFDEFKLNDAENIVYTKYPNVTVFKEELQKFWKTWTTPESRKDEDINDLKKYFEILTAFTKRCEDIKGRISSKKMNHEHLSKDDIAMFKIASWHENYLCHWNDFITAIDVTGVDYLLKDITIANDDKHISVAFKCTKEDYIVWYFLLRKAPYKVMLSATVGTKAAFDERMGFHYEEKDDYDHENSIVDKSFMTVIPSTFDFNESPIYFFNKFKMSFNEREISFRHLKTVIYSICSTKFKEQKGMIQTGSYEFAKRLYNDAPLEIKQRMLVYNGSREKVTMVKLHQMSQDTILVGPTLNTGIDLPGDDCRFIIILKVPYPTLMDKLVNARNKLYPLWYNSHTSNEIIQGIGRGVRYDGDWCVTYILDACFKTLYNSTKNQYPIELQNRIKII